MRIISHFVIGVISVFLTIILILSIYLLIFVDPDEWEGNPAQLYCEQNGGDYFVEDGCPFCELADGRLVNAWDYFYGRLNETG